jgi:hypothetical protein
VTNAPAAFIAWCIAHPTDSKAPGQTWDQKCVALLFRAGGFTSSFTSAYYAGVYTRAHHGLDTTTPYDQIPKGWIVYFDKAGPTNGHIGMVTTSGRFASANWRVDNYGTALGDNLTIAAYVDTGAIYMGASPYFGDETLDLSGNTSVASSTTTAIPDLPAAPLTLGDTMIRIQSDNRGIALIGPGYFRGLHSTEEVIASDVLIEKHLTGNDRQFDLWASMALGGQVPEIDAASVAVIAAAVK